MIPPPPIANEDARLAALRSLDLLDTPPEPEYDDIARLAAEICGTPMAAVTLVDEARQWFKAAVGLPTREGPREHSFCGHAIAAGHDGLLIVGDAGRDPRFHDNPLVTGDPGIRFYAGAPLLTREGLALGSLCVIDRQPRELTPGQRRALDALRRAVQRSLELRQVARAQQRTIRELVDTQAALQRARLAAETAKSAQGLYFAAVTHEIRTPLTAVLGMTSELRATTLTPQQADCVKTIAGSGEMLLAVVNDLLDFSKIESGRIEIEQTPFSLRTVVAESLRIVAQAAKDKGLGLTSELAPGLPETIVGDPTRLRQILVNLLANAVKFTDRGGIDVVARPGADANGRPLVHFSVRDTGIGLRPEQLGRLFEVYQQADPSTARRFGGTGLGLAISKRLAELLGGTMWVDSREGQGATFHFTVALGPPADSTPAPVAPRRFDASFAVRHPCRILAADDNAINQRVLRSILNRLGYQPRIAADGVEAIAALTAEPADVILMDLEMPGLDGRAATERIRREFSDDHQPVIIALTAHAGPDARAGALAAGMDEFLSKPLQPELLADLLSRWRSLRPVAALSLRSSP